MAIGSVGLALAVKGAGQSPAYVEASPRGLKVMQTQETQDLGVKVGLKTEVVERSI